ncbi:unnamed protein product [Phytophthora lilii]|uniref:Unnamed protein product n=1 Tax=Phytophthora lilii TaxID=2077276 RepID=A0A9W7CU33_9STRA|nr:unnamed protein product [Phytophthora lilii]
MDGVRKVADSGRTIICTIHQPSSEVFYLFDSLLLLKRGGETVFYGNLGKNCRNLVDYFESIPGVAPLPKGYNPATWMLECIGAGVSNSAAAQTNFVDYFNKSSYRQVINSEMAKEGVTVPSPNLPEMVFAKKRAATSATQMKFVVTRFFQMYWRTPTYNLTRMILAIFLALLFGIVFVDAEYASYSGLNSGVGMVYMASLFLSMTAFQSVLPLTSSERASFYRERASQTYNAFWYFLGSTLAELPYCFVLGALFTVVFYPMVGFTDVGVAFIFWLATSLSVLMQVYMGQMFSYAMPSEEVAAIIGLLFNAIFMMFMGFSPPAYAIPSGYTWLYKISPLRFPVSILVALIFSDCDELPTWNETTQAYENVGSKLGCQPMADSPVTVGHITIKEYTEEYFGMKHDTITDYFFVIIGCIVLFRVLALIALRYINHQKRCSLTIPEFSFKSASMGVSTPVARDANITFDSGEGLMAKGPEALHDLMLHNLEASTGRAMPRMDVRFNNLSVTADVVVVEDDGSKHELPTLPNTVKKAFAGPKKRSVRKEILKNVSGVFKPGTITLLLGQPGSGKSSLMKMLSARFPEGKNITVEGDISFNNVPRKQILDRLPQFVSYVDQRDKHFAPLTVKETLEFAYQVCGGDITKRKKFLASLPSEKENVEALQATKTIFQHYPDVVIQQLGLKNCQDTIVGDAMIRGVSGGERKRVTTGEMEFGMKFVSMMDEISTGLDSAATFDIIKTQRSIAHKLNKTVVIALLQPSPEIFALFDNVMILNEGELMYHGPCSKVESYFESLGFMCPPERDIADYLLDLGTRQQYRYEVEQGSTVPRQPHEFGESFRQSTLYQDTLNSLEAPYESELLKTVKENMDPMPQFQQSFLESTAALFKREIMITYRNKAFIFGRLLMILVMGLLFSTIYYDFDPTQVSVATGVIFSSVMFLSMGQSSQLPVFMVNRDIFYKQRGANFYRTSSYVLANSVGGIPLSLAETIIFGSLVYWMCGFAAEAELFIIFEFILLLSNLAMGMWFFFLSSVCSHENIATPLCMMSILIFIIFAGFIVTTDEIPDYLIWAHWISPMSWSLKALAINQYRSSAFDICVYGAIDYCTEYGLTMGEYYLSLFGLDTGKEWVFYGIIYLAAIYVVFMFLSYLALEHLRYEAPANVDVSEKAADDGSYALVETPKSSAKPSETVEIEVNTHEKNFTPVTVAFQDLHYWVPDPHNPKEQLELLKGINGLAVPGSITALMGSSGAGKTTLMDVIAGRKTGGKITGKILLNGYEATDLAIRQVRLGERVH